MFVRFQARVEQAKTQIKKYTVRPPKDLTSKYDAYMHQRHLNKIQADKDRLQEEENRRIAVRDSMIFISVFIFIFKLI